LVAAVGALSAWQPLAALAAVGVLYLLLRGERVLPDLFALLLVGNVVLTYGFANLGLRLEGVPLPLTELILLPMAGYCLLSRRTLPDMGLPGVLMAALLVFASLRLILDYPAHGNFALRDFTTPLETLALVVGFWCFTRFGLRWAHRVWLAASLCVLAYGLLFPFAAQLEQAGPIVGIYQNIPLLGQYAGSGPAILFAFFFVLLRLRAPTSIVLGAACLGVVAIFQLRGLYIALPLGALVVMLAGGRIGTGLAVKIGGSVAIGLILLALVLPLGPQGRLGPVSASFATSQLATLLGREGPGDGSFGDRIEWVTQIWQQQAESPLKLVFGLGLGPDLAGGALTTGDQLIRKPHNDYLEMMARFGLVGLLLWGAFFASLLRPVWLSLSRQGISADERSFQLFALAGASAYMLIAATQPVLAFPYGTVPLFSLLGMGLAQARIVEARARQVADSTTRSTP
jgi:O-antigen ligase